MRGLGLPFETGGATRPWRGRPIVIAIAGVLLAVGTLGYTGDGHAQPAAPVGATIEGRVRVIDGDTLRFDEHTIRLWGVDAPAAQQICQRDGKPWACGDASRSALEAYVANRRVRCDVLAQREGALQHGRCRAGRDDLNDWVVHEGWALDRPGGDGARRYTRLQNDAAMARRGLWQGQFVEPWAWRSGASPASAVPR